MRVHSDARRRFVGDIFDTPDGDINITQLHPGVVVAWHRHQKQDDRIYCAFGRLHVQAISPTGQRHQWWLDSPHSHAVTIPSNWWHGYATTDGAVIVSFNGPGKWDGSDEERHPIDDEMPWGRE